MTRFMILVAIWAYANGLSLSGAIAQEKDGPLNLVIACSDDRAFLKAQFPEHLEENFNVTIRWVKGRTRGKGGSNANASAFTGIEALDECDVILSNLYRTWAPERQMPQIKRAFLAKPIVGMRRSAHGFQNWLDAD